MQELHKLTDGVYARFKVKLQNKATAKPIKYAYFNRYLESRNIEICHSCIRINSKEKFIRPDWLLKDREKEVV